MKRETQHIAKLIRKNISMIDSKAEIILYGSRARGDDRPDSDWDILVLTDYPVDLNKERVFRDNLYDLELETGESFSVFVFSKNDWTTRQKITPFYNNVIQEGVVL
jgi:predicted nucleotidyltransferase